MNTYIMIQKGTRLKTKDLCHEIREVTATDVFVARCGKVIKKGDYWSITRVDSDLNCPKCISEIAKVRNIAPQLFKLQLLFGEEKAKAIEDLYRHMSIVI